ncbi:MAG: nuclear transport factor 2 family protein [Bacteroidia bacterium]|nr:nuclear transport factor 2 family protein [Bacteroidia bacterium]
MQELITRFYEAFQVRDAAGMNACYHEDIVFTDPAFGTLKGDDARAMWTMLCQNATDLKVEFSNVELTNTGGKAHWEAWYTFSQTGRPVHNIIDAEFEFKDGKIIRHTDTFNLHKWAKQALGFKGWLLGGTGFFEKKLHEQTNGLLEKFKARQNNQEE